MDALLSLPLLSYLVVPGITTYSTSLNILFFYMTWATLVLTQPPLRVELIGTLAVRLLFFAVPSLLFLLFDSLLPSLAVNIKSQGAAGLPTRSAARQKTPSKSRARRITGGSGAGAGGGQPSWYFVLAVALANILLGAALQAATETLFTSGLGIRSALKITTTLPTPWHMAKDLLRGLVLREFLQYYPHRFLLHSPRSPYLSAYHSRWHHAVRAPYSLSAHHDHPAAWVLWRFLPTYGPAVLFRFHLLTYLLFLSFLSLEECLSSSGYSILPSILLRGVARRQDAHHATCGAGNFAPWGLADWMHGTNVSADDSITEDVKDELRAHDVGARAEDVWEGAKTTVRRKGRERVASAGRPRRKSRALQRDSDEDYVE
ncbi:MAG: hypothetical protein M1832_004861 [Thelocarpon impressellum]|nr:MAG: hypothetical protein M1832_004861 [Thelocarpon impressellum]